MLSTHFINRYETENIISPLCIFQGWKRHGNSCYQINTKAVSFENRCNATVRNRLKKMEFNIVFFCPRARKSCDSFYFTGSNRRSLTVSSPSRSVMSLSIFGSGCRTLRTRGSTSGWMDPRVWLDTPTGSYLNQVRKKTKSSIVP